MRKYLLIAEQQAHIPLHSRRQFLKGGLAVCLISTAGCMFGTGSGSECSTGRTQHELDVILRQTASWPMYQYDAANTDHTPDARESQGAGEIAWRYSACTEAESEAVVHKDEYTPVA